LGIRTLDVSNVPFARETQYPKTINCGDLSLDFLYHVPISLVTLASGSRIRCVCSPAR